MIAAEGQNAIRRMIVAYRRGDGAAVNYEIGWVTVALQHLRVGRCLGPDKSRAVDPMVRQAAARARGGARHPARLGEQSSALGHGAMH